MRRDSATVVAAAALAVLADGSLAHAAPAPPPPPYEPGTAAVHQYREALPTSGGAILPGGPGRALSETALPPAIAAQVRALGTRGRFLERVATSPAYGAPARAMPTRTSSGAAIGLPSASVSERLTAAGRAFLDGAIGRLGLLLVLLAGLTAWALATTARSE